MKITTHPPQSSQDSIVILRSADGKPLTKTHRWTDNAWRTTAYGNAYLFTPSTKPLGSLADLSAILAQLEHDKAACVVRGALCEPDNTQPIRRKLHGEAATLTKRDRFWVGFDLDDIPAPAWLNPNNAESLRKAVRYAITTTLPAAFHEAACFYSWTSSAGVKGWNELRLRVWFWGDRAICDDSLREAFGKGRSAVDASLFNAVQVHYTAAPVFEGVPDPLAGVRSGTLSGAQVVTFPAYLLNQSDHDAKRERDKPQHVEAVEIIEAQSGDVRRRLEREADSVRERIESAGVGGRHAAILRGATRLAGLTKAGYLTSTQALFILDNAASEALHGESGRDDEAANAFAWAMNTVKARYLSKELAPVEAVEIPPRHATLESARVELASITQKTLDTPGLHVIKAAPGAGKTHAVLRGERGIAQRVLEDGARVIFAVPTTATRGEFKEDAQKAVRAQMVGREFVVSDLLNRGFVEEVTRTKKTCEQFATYTAVASKAPGAGNHFCKNCSAHPRNGGACPFVLARGKRHEAKALFTTHESLVRAFHTTKTPSIEFRWSELAKLGGKRVRPVLRTTQLTNAITATPDESGFLLPVTSADDDHVDELLTALAYWLECDVDPQAIAFELSTRGDVRPDADYLIVDEDISSTLVGSVSLDAVQIANARRAGDIAISADDERSLGDLLAQSMTVDESGRTPNFTADDLRTMVGVDFVTMPEHSTYTAGIEAVNAHTEGGGVSALHEAPDYAALDALRQAIERGFEGVKVVRGALVLPHMRPVDFGRIATTVVAIDATTTIEVARACYGADVSFYNVEVAKPESLTVINITKPMAKSAVRDGAFRYESNRELFGLVHGGFDSPGTLHVLPGKRGWTDQKEDDEIAQILSSLLGKYIYPNGLSARGSNLFESFGVVVVDTYHVPGHAIETKAADLCRLAGDVWSDTADQWREQAKNLLVYAPVVQAAGRIRPLQSTEQKPKTIIMFEGESLAKYSHVLSVDQTIEHHALPLYFAVKNAGGSIAWVNMLKRGNVAYSLEWSNSPTKSPVYIGENVGDLDHSSNHAGQTHFDGVLDISANVRHFKGGLSELAQAAGVQTVELQTSKGGEKTIGFHNGFDTEQERDKLTKIGYNESWTWFEFEGKRVDLDYFEEWLFDALAQPDELPETAVGVYDLIGEFMNKSRSHVQRRLKAAGMTIADVRSMFETFNMFEDVSGGYYEIPADDIADEAYEHASADLVEHAWNIREFRVDYKKYARSERSRAWYTPHSFKNPYPEPLSFRCWLLDIWLPKNAPTQLESLNAIRAKEVAQ